MQHAPILRAYLETPMLENARAGSFNFLNILREAVEDAGWRVEWRKTGEAARLAAPARRGYALYHMEAPTHERALTFRRAYHYPFWSIEPVAQRWRFHVAETEFAPDAVDPEEARAFAAKLRGRVLPGPPPTQGDRVLVPLQGHIRRCRSFQSESPVEMVRAVARTGRPTLVTLHPNERYDDADHAALARITAEHPNVTIGGDTMAALRDCAFVVTQNSAVAFDGFLLGKPAVLFAQSDFHHIALNVAQIGTEEALARAAAHRPAFERYLFWFLRVMAVNATAPDARQQVLAAMRRGGWPI
ncbi:hypothetical protein [Paracoccus sulfuroxidans]|uniref:Capsular polysaccharide biosynthesis protein n=1 Tax=Paracoccus sulfuroxidans TaxID=384678 RepID=A0A562NMD0_9RHOB|nr:hypothetical protein [Paracoccus sulfuroxidans]TWI33344.1 hypothetical protein IQ24_02485 [Paracoccus sulfuroxidans]